MALGEATMSPFSGGYEKAWTDVFRTNLPELFQLALLLTADSHEAEAILSTVIRTLDFSKQPDEDALAVLQTAVAQQSIGSGGAVSWVGTVEGRSILQTGLRSVLQLERLPRVCFVLRMLLGYGLSTCAGMLGIDQDGVKVLIRVAFLQLHHAALSTSLRLKKGLEA
jgi:hypothetical protein